MNSNKKSKIYEYKVMSVVIMLFMVIVLGIVSIVNYSKGVTDSLSQQVIRFHVVANSDTTDDQLLKQKVRDEVIGFMEPLIKNCESIDETRYILQGSIPIIKEITEEVVVDWGKDYEVYVALDKANFPTKSYGDVIFPAGEYEAYRIIIGAGKGENWWCVMYPPLCYLDVATGVVPLEGKEQLESELNQDQYKLVTEQGNKRYEVKFKLVDTINSLFGKSDYQTKH